MYYDLEEYTLVIGTKGQIEYDFVYIFSFINILNLKMFVKTNNIQIYRIHDKLRNKLIYSNGTTCPIS